MTLKLLIAVVTGLMLLSMGAQFYAAPVLLPALWWAARSSKTWAAAGFTVLAALLMTEVGWLVAYTTTGESQPWYALWPAFGFVSTVTAFVLTRRRRRRRRGMG